LRRYGTNTAYSQEIKTNNKCPAYLSRALVILKKNMQEKAHRNVKQVLICYNKHVKPAELQRL
jgi:hypothetical protein